MKNFFYFFMFRDVPVCSGMFHVPGSIDAHKFAPAAHVFFELAKKQIARAARFLSSFAVVLLNYNAVL